jgi:hypothetical protein
MKHFIAAALMAASLLSFAAPSRAADLSVTLSDQDQMGWTRAGPAMEQCLSGAMLRDDGAICRNLYQFLRAFAGRVQTARVTADAAAAKAAAAAPPAETPEGYAVHPTPPGPPQ